jgi:hypothetical protein
MSVLYMSSVLLIYIRVNKKKKREEEDDGFFC